MGALRKPKSALEKLPSNSHRRSRTQERELAKRIGGEVTRGSGNGKWQKGDIQLKGVLRIEAKTTKNKSFSVTREMWRKIEEEAMTNDETPIIVIEFIDDKGNPESSLAVCPVHIIDEIVAYAGEEK